MAVVSDWGPNPNPRQSFPCCTIKSLFPPKLAGIRLYRKSTGGSFWGTGLNEPSRLNKVPDAVPHPVSTVKLALALANCCAISFPGAPEKPWTEVCCASPEVGSNEGVAVMDGNVYVWLATALSRPFDAVVIAFTVVVELIVNGPV